MDKIITIRMPRKPIANDSSIAIGCEYCFHLVIKIPEDYPRQAPKIKIKSYFNHPNVFGSWICLDMLEGQWSVFALQLKKVGVVWDVQFFFFFLKKKKKKSKILYKYKDIFMYTYICKYYNVEKKKKDSE
ncbi:hypothetical protein RFI_18719 [Reticulomyxa filosa]|uniref:UBC core domain-containing protein n=1 Tax=Reticulomyxa filosa TaxID=46433 RepID=X6MY36_RETFI|nr:hypothetical protein RFI_18719 [Reticulomyxa filosa]|eukprot:ETO18546.1 hypothetical protein RFI_18719 [Reticulomyxa filosa]